MTPEARIELLAYRLKEYILSKPPWPPDLTPLDEIAKLAVGLQDELAEERALQMEDAEYER